MTLDELLIEIERDAFVRYVNLSDADARSRYLRDCECAITAVTAGAFTNAYRRARLHNERMAHLASLPLGE